MDSPKPRLCLVYGVFPHLGGISSIMEDLWDCLSATFDVHILANANSGPTERYSRFLHTRSRWVFNVQLFPLMWFFAVYMAWHLYRLHREHRFVCLLPQDAYCSAFACAIVGKLAGVPVVVMDHGTATNMEDPFWLKSMAGQFSGGFRAGVKKTLFLLGGPSQKLIRRCVCALGDEFLLVGKELERYYAAHHVPSSKVAYYKHLVNSEFFKPAGPMERIALRRGWQVEEGDFLIAIVCRLDPEKGFEYMLPALKRLANDFPTLIRVIIAGTGYRQAFIDEFIKANNLMRNIRMVGNQTKAQVRDLFQASDVHLYAGHVSCNMTISVLEAMACGVPCVVTPVPELQRTVISPDRGWVFEPKSVQAAYEALSDAVRQKDELPSKGANSRRYIEENHSFPVAAKAIESSILNKC